MTPEEEYAGAVRNRLAWIDRHPDKLAPPRWTPDEPHGWSPMVQEGRRATVRHKAERYSGQYDRPGDRDPIPGWPHLPPIHQCGPVIAHLRELAAAEAAKQEPVEEDAEGAAA